MHEDEVDIDGDLVRQLIVSQFPHLSELEVREVRSTGTVNAIYRLGEDLCVRLPRLEKWANELEHEAQWLRTLGPQLPLAVPAPVAMGMPGGDYPFQWAIYNWLEGEIYSVEGIDDECQAANDLAGFISELQRVDVLGAPRLGRQPLRELDQVTRAAIQSIVDGIDTDAATAVWDHALQFPGWQGEAVWRHNDLLPSNILVLDCRLHAVIDFGTAGIGDPANDFIAAWTLFGEIGRSCFRDALQIDDETWVRARGYALHQALLIIPYYVDTNPDFAVMATRTVQEVLKDYET